MSECMVDVVPTEEVGDVVPTEEVGTEDGRRYVGTEGGRTGARNNADRDQQFHSVYLWSLIVARARCCRTCPKVPVPTTA